jgi:hypothetical protein
MYIDRSPVPNCQSGGKVLVIEAGDEDHPDEIVESAPTTIDVDGDKIYWVVFAKEPGRVWDCTEEALRSSLRSK